MPTVVQSASGLVAQAEATTLNYANTSSVNGKDLKASAKKRRFQEIFPRLKAELVDAFKASNMPTDATEWFDRNLEYNVPYGKLNRGISVVDTVEIIRGVPLDDEEYYKAATLGWCVELLQSMFLVSDDIMDASITRRGQPCWYRLPQVGNIAINDAFLLESCIYFLLKKQFRSAPYYLDLLELLHETTFQTEMGQLVDLITAPEEHVDLNRFSLEKHQYIVIYKTAFYSFYLPVALGMYMAGITDSALFEHAKKILIPLGEYFQVQDDYLDCYGAPEFIGKIGTDILDNKCSWNINIALKYATADQRKVLDENYGQKNAECEKRVKQVFEEIGVERRYKEYQEDAYKRISGLIDELDETPSGDSPVLKRQVFRAFLEKIYGRTK